MTDAHVNRHIVRQFKLRGLGIKANAVSALVSVLRREDANADEALQQILDAINGLIERKELKSSIVDVSTIEAVVLQLTKNQDDYDQEAIALFDAFSMPRLNYDPTTKSATYTHDPSRPLNPSASAKARMFRDRYLLVQQRVLRSKYFVAPIVSRGPRHDAGYLKIVTVDSLLGTTGVKNLLGVLTQVEEGQYYIEDLTGHVPIDLRHCDPSTSGIFTENSIVLAGGEIVDGKFRVYNLGFPPPEPRAESLKMLRSLEFFGKGFMPQQMQDLAEMETQAQDVMVIILSDVHLDRPHILDKLRNLFSGFDQCEDATLLFVLMGNFSSKPVSHGHDGTQQLIGYFDGLATMLKEFPKLCKDARFIFMPGPHDPGAGPTLPRFPLSSVFTRGLKGVLSNVSFTTNPCKLRLYTQEITLFREDMLKKMLRHAVFEGHAEDSNSDDPVVDCMITTLLDQGHLCPLPLSSRPILWEYDNALRLYPLPDVLVLADHMNHFSRNYMDCQVLSPGSFPVDSSFIVYYPATRTAEISRVEQ